MMTFAEFYTAVRERADSWYSSNYDGPEHCSAQVSADRYGGGVALGDVVTWNAYIAPMGHTTGPTPEKVLAALDKKRAALAKNAKGENHDPNSVELGDLPTGDKS